MYVHVCVQVAVCMSNVCTHVITVYLIAVKTKMCLEMLHMKKQGPSMDVQEKRENFNLLRRSGKT